MVAFYAASSASYLPGQHRPWIPLLHWAPIMMTLIHLLHKHSSLQHRLQMGNIGKTKSRTPPPLITKTAGAAPT
jgi:hypothetical protein